MEKMKIGKRLVLRFETVRALKVKASIRTGPLSGRSNAACGAVEERVNEQAAVAAFTAALSAVPCNSAPDPHIGCPGRQPLIP